MNIVSINSFFPVIVVEFVSINLLIFFFVVQTILFWSRSGWVSWPLVSKQDLRNESLDISSTAMIFDYFRHLKFDFVTNLRSNERIFSIFFYFFIENNEILQQMPQLIDVNTFFFIVNRYRSMFKMSAEEIIFCVKILANRRKTKRGTKKTCRSSYEETFSSLNFVSIEKNDGIKSRTTVDG